MKTIRRMGKIALLTYIILSVFNLGMYYGFHVDVWNITLPLSFIFFFSLYLREFSDELNFLPRRIERVSKKYLDLISKPNCLRPSAAIEVKR